jgi:hypothetical protein
MMKRKCVVFAAAAIVIAMHVPADAAPIPVANNSFENPATAGFQDNSGIAAGTALPNMSNSWYYLGGFSAGGSPVGVENTAANGAQPGGDLLQNGYVNVGAALGSANLGAIQPNTTYTLTAGVTGRTNGFNSTSGAAIAIASVPSGVAGDANLASPANWLASNSIPFSSLVPAGFKDYQATFTTGASGGAIGQQLVVVLMSQNNPGSNNPIGFDNVRVDAKAVPEPTAYMLMAWGGLCVRRRVRRSLQ